MHGGFCHRFWTDRVLHRRKPDEHHHASKCQVDGMDPEPSLPDNGRTTSVGYSGTADSRAVPDLAAAGRANPAELPRAFLRRFPTGISSELERCDDRLYPCRGTW